MLTSGGAQGGAPRASSRTLRWSKEGGTQPEYLRDRYACLQESQEQHSRVAVTRYGGGGRSSQVTNAGMFMACMSARGYMRDDNGPFVPPEGTEISIE